MDKIKEKEVDHIEQAIKGVASTFKNLLKSKLTEKAIVVLIYEMTPAIHSGNYGSMRKIPKTYIRAFIKSCVNLDKKCLKS